ncbi:MAG: S8 family serine peptidase [Phycisphaerae bacterium]
MRASRFTSSIDINPSHRLRAPAPVAMIASCAAFVVASSAFAYPSGIGLSALLAANPNLTGSGVNVAQVEASLSSSTDEFEVNPTAANQPQSLFTYIDDQGTSSSTYSSANYSSHATSVGNLFYGGIPSGSSSAYGVAPKVASVANYDANGFAQYNLGLTVNSSTQMFNPPGAQTQTVNKAQVINQSFRFDIPATLTPAQQEQYVETIDWAYDQYVNTYNTVIVSAVGNGAYTAGYTINPPATAYNSIAVGSSNGQTEDGPTFDGRSKPDIVAPGGETSYATPLVSGAAALMVQAGNDSIGYVASNTSGSWSQSQYDYYAVLPQTVKALLMNGAVQPKGWTHTDTSPLDPRYGAGVLNVDNAYQILAAGRAAATASNQSTTVQTNPTITQASGWDVETLDNNGSKVGANPTTFVDHYAFKAIAANPGQTDSFKATLVWNTQTTATGSGANAPYSEQQTPIFLELFNAANGSLVSESISTVDNVQQIDTLLTPGDNYDLQVLTSGGNYNSSDVYALAFSTSPVAVVTPEPAALGLMGVGAGLLLLRRNRRSLSI